MIGGEAGRARVIHRATWALIDQGLFSLGNFGTGVLLARWLAPSDYGTFVVAYSFFLLLATVHTSLIADPLLVFAPGRFVGRFRGYLGALLRGHAIVVAVGSVLVLAGALIAGILSHETLAKTLVALAIGLPFILSYWLARRTFYVEGMLPLAAAGAAANLVLTIAGLYILKRSGELSETRAFLVMGATSGVVAVCLGLRQLLAASGSAEADAGAVFREHFRYARFGLAASALGWVPASIFFLVLPFRHTLGASGELRALVNFTQPALQVFNALATVLVPVFVRLRGSRQFWTLGGRMTALFTAASVAYWLVVVLCGERLLQLFYHGRYDDLVHLLPVVATLTIAAAPAALLTAMLQALERPDRVMVAWIASAVVAATLGMLLTWRWGVGGAAAGMTLAFLTAALMMAVAIMRRWAVRSQVDDEHTPFRENLDIHLLDADRSKIAARVTCDASDTREPASLTLRSAIASENLP